MKMYIKEFAELTGVSVRTLHYYDEIGLPHPADVDRFTGYRFYDEQSLLRMQEILFYRELDFSLKNIAKILSSPHYDKTKALQEQKQLLKLKKERLERLMDAIDDAEKGENVMNVFDNREFEIYKAEAQERWGETDAYGEYLTKTEKYSKNQWSALADKMNEILAKFAVCMKQGRASDSDEAQKLVEMLRCHITENYYNCTPEILAGLGQMYVADERFKNNIDQNGDGTSMFISEAIEVYVQPYLGC